MHALTYRNAAAAAVICCTLQPLQAISAEGNDGSELISEVIVTAQKRSESIQDVPIAVSAFTEEALKARGLDSGGDLRLAIPNVSFSRTDINGFNFQIRGIGSPLIASSADAAVGIHENNVPLTASRLADAEFYDVERVEVLRGPQGTLYGRNATGGVVNLITAKPIDEFKARLSAEYGDFNTWKADGFLNVPLADSLAVRVAGIWVKRDGLMKNTITGSDTDGRDLSSTRVTAKYTPTKSLSASLMWEHFDEDDSRTRFARQLCTKDPGPTSVGGTPTNTLTRGFLSQACLPQSIYSSAAYGGPNSLGTADGIIGVFTGLVGGDVYANKVQSRDLRQMESSFDPTYRARNDLVSLSLEYTPADDYLLTFLGSYDEDRSYSRQNTSGIYPTVNLNASPMAPGGVLTDPQLGSQTVFQGFQNPRSESRQWTGEVRLQSSYNGPVNFSVGGIYVDYDSTLTFIQGSNGFTALSTFRNTQGAGIYIDPTPDLDLTGHNYLNSENPYRLKAAAGFGEIYWDMAKDVKLTLGLRYTSDDKSVVDYDPGFLQAGRGQKFLGTRQATFNELTGRANLQWMPDLSFTDETLLYASYSRGYKGGGFNGLPAAGEPPINGTFDPEFVNAYEIGTKNTLFGGALLLNATAFHYDYQDYQIGKVVIQQTINENVDAKVNGVELEAVLRPTHSLQFNAAIGYLDTSITDGESVDIVNRTQGDPNLTLVKGSGGANCVANTSGVAGVLQRINAGQLPATALLGLCSGAFASSGVVVTGGAFAALKDKELPNAPRWTVAFGGQYALDLSPDLSATLRADYYWQSDSFARIYNDTSDRLRSWKNVNLSLTFAHSTYGFEAQFYVKNLLDDTVILTTTTNGDQTGLESALYLNDPRTMGLRLTKHF